MSRNTFLSTLPLLALALVQPGVALAQEGAAPAEDATTADAGRLDDIVVTATKRETNLQKTPIAMNVVNMEAIKDRHVQSLYDLADGGVPSLRVATFEARQSALTIGIRGIVPLDANQPAREQGVGIYVDGVYLGRQHGLNAALFDVERVEVLKGPQGTLFGRNTEGGALSIVSRAPSGKFGGRVEAGFGNLGAYTGSLHLDLPEYHNFSVKLDAVKQYQGPTTENPMSGQAGWGYYDRTGGRVAVRWQPIDDITNDFSYDVAEDKNTPFYSQLLNVNPNNCPSGGTTASPIAASSAPACYLNGTAYTGLQGTIKPVPSSVVVNGSNLMRTADIGVPQQPSVDKTHGFTNSFKWKISPEIELRSITAWRGVDVTQWDNSGGAHRVPVMVPGATFSRYSLANLRQRQFSQEFQAVGSISSIDYVVGLFYFNEHVSDNAATPLSNVWNTDTVNNVTGVAVPDGQPDVINGTQSTINLSSLTNPFASIDRASEVRSKSYAAYGQATWHATDAIHLTVGGRFTHDKKYGELLLTRNAAPTAAAGYAPLDKSWDRFNPMVTLAYDVSNDVHLYAKYATGYRAGGASSRTSNYQTFNPEDVKSYEVGMKADFWDHRARLNLAGYIMDRKNSQVDISSIQGTFNNLVTINAPGITKIRGIEADLTVQPIDGLTLNASYAYTYTKIPPVLITYTAGGVSTNVYQNFYIVFTPRNAASGSIDYALPVGGGDTKLKFHIDGNYSQSTQTFDQFAIHNDASLLFNARVSLVDIDMGEGGQKLTVGLWGRNIFNESYVYRRDPSNSLPAAPTSSVTTGNVGNILGDYGNFNAPRTYGLEATVKF